MRSSSMAALALGLAACAGRARLETRTFELRHLEAGRAGDLLAQYVYTDRAGAPGGLRLAGNLVTVRETADNLDRIARVLEQYDRPSPPVQLRFQVIQADGYAGTDSSIADVEAALRQLFRFRGYRSVAQAAVGGLEGSRVSQKVGGEGGPYHIEANIMELRGSGDSVTVRLWVRFIIEASGSLETAVNVRAGQTVILGNAAAPANRGTVILTVRPEVAKS
jgi:hypothetical protein